MKVGLNLYNNILYGGNWVQSCLLPTMIYRVWAYRATFAPSLHKKIAICYLLSDFDCHTSIYFYMSYTTRSYVWTYYGFKVVCQLYHSQVFLLLANCYLENNFNNSSRHIAYIHIDGVRYDLLRKLRAVVATFYLVYFQAVLVYSYYHLLFTIQRRTYDVVVASFYLSI